MERGMTSSEVAYVQNLEEFNDVDADRIQYLMGEPYPCVLYGVEILSGLVG